jgi:plastocyanin domain-containing protein
MKSSTITYILAAVVLIGIVIAGYVMIGGSEKTTNNVNLGNGDVQNIVIGMKDLNYYPETITVKANQPVSLSLDKSVTGCFRAIVIKDFGVNEWLKKPSDTVEFVPTKLGTYRYSCAMGMGWGTIIVEE